MTEYPGPLTTQTSKWHEPTLIVIFDFYMLGGEFAAFIDFFHTNVSAVVELHVLYMSFSNRHRSIFVKEHFLLFSCYPFVEEV